jgi:thiol-disulfide isomerase/thioredoxin
MDPSPTDLDPAAGLDGRAPRPRRRAATAWVGAAVAIVVVAAVAYVVAGRAGSPSTAATGGHANPLLGQAPPIGKHLPDVTLPRFGGGSVSLASATGGKPLVINLWAATCAPCVSEMPDLERISHEYGGRVGFLGVDTQESEYAGRPLARATGVTYPLASDPTAKVFTWVRSLGLPTTLVVGPDGRLRQVHVGRVDPSQLRSWLDQALG